MKVKPNKILFLLLFFSITSLILWMAFGTYEKTRIIFERNILVAVILSILIIGVGIFSLIKILDNRPVIILSQTGIWTKKTGDVLWKDISSFHAKSTKAEYFDSTAFYFKIARHEKVLVINTTFLSPNINKIVEYININSTNKDIVNSGHEYL